MQNYYQLLSVDPAASPKEIKRAFRQEIARYHPDKVQHLGKEFQDMAAMRAAQLTEGYRTLMDAELRAEYDRLLASNQGLDQPSAEASQAGPPPSPNPGQPEPAQQAPAFAQSTPSGQPPSQFSFERTTRDEFVRKATLGRLRQALTAEFGAFDEPAMKGFELSCAVKSKKLFGLGGGARPRFVGKFVSQVDRAAVQEAWAMAAKARGGSDICVFLLGSGIAPARELADTIAEQRRRGSGAGRVVMIPVDVRDWNALVPNDAPASCKAVLQRLRAKSIA